MTTFKARFVYPIFIVFVIFFLFWSAVLTIVLINTLLTFTQLKSMSNAAVILGEFCLPGLIALLSGNMLSELRYGLKIADNQVMTFDHWRFRWEDIADKFR